MTEDDHKVAENIIEFAKKCYEENQTPIIISSLTNREDFYKERIQHVNRHLKEMTNDRNIGFIEHKNLLGKYHLNKSKLHLNKKGTSILTRNLQEIISNWLICPVPYSNDDLSENENQVAQNPLKTLKHGNDILFSYLNVNSVRNKFNEINEVILKHVDILCVAETKLDSSFPNSQFSVHGFKEPLRLDVSGRSGGLMLYAKSHLPLRRLECDLISTETQCLITELNLRKSKWLILSIYRNPTQNLKLFLDELTKVLDFYSNSFENFLIMGDFNEEPNHQEMKEFMTSFSLNSLIIIIGQIE